MVIKNEAIKNLKILNIPLDVDFSLDDVHQAYVFLAKMYHPDKNKVNDSHRKMIAANEAYSYIKNNYDEIKKLQLHVVAKSNNEQNQTKKIVLVYYNKKEKNIRTIVKIIIYGLLLCLGILVILSLILALIAGNA